MGQSDQWFPPGSEGPRCFHRDNYIGLFGLYGLGEMKAVTEIEFYRHCVQPEH